MKCVLRMLEWPATYYLGKREKLDDWPAQFFSD